MFSLRTTFPPILPFYTNLAQNWRTALLRFDKVAP